MGDDARSGVTNHRGQVLCYVSIVKRGSAFAFASVLLGTVGSVVLGWANGVWFHSFALGIMLGATQEGRSQAWQAITEAWELAAVLRTVAWCLFAACAVCVGAAVYRYGQKRGRWVWLDVLTFLLGLVSIYLSVMAAMGAHSVWSGLVLALLAIFVGRLSVKRRPVPGTSRVMALGSIVASGSTAALSLVSELIWMGRL
jgi:hypothetical protein